MGVKWAIQGLLSGPWRSAVYRHDVGEPVTVFHERFKYFNFGDAQTKFRQHFAVHVFDMESSDLASSLSTLIETTLKFPRANVGVPFDFAEHLQMTHALLGSVEFKKRFNAKTKEDMLAVWNNTATVEIEPITAPLF